MLYETKKEIFNKLISIASRDELIWMNGYLSGLLSASNIDDPVITEDNATVAAIEKLTILYATETGNTKAIATKFASATKKLGIKTKLISADQYRLSDLQKEEYFFIVISTQGDGEPPVAATKFFNAIHETDLVLNKLRYGVLALGDSSYPLFCKAGEDVDVQLALRGAKRVIELQKCDTDYEDIAGEWFEKVLSVLNNQSNFKAASQKISAKSTGKKIYEGTIVTNINLNDIGSQKETHHIEIIAQDVMYHSGDALGIIPENPSSVLKEILHLTGINAETKILWQGEQYSVSALLAKKLQIIYLHERVVKKYAAIVQQDIPETRINLTDLLKIYPVKNEEIFLQVMQILEPIAPRLYSVASSPEAHSGEVHITVAKDKFLVNEKEETGLCSGYLSQLSTETKINFYIHPNKAFRLPAGHHDIIMIGPGTGIAPFRSFLFERDAQGASGRNWLFFGDQHFTSDFLYQTEIQSFIETGLLTRFNAAFSRDQEHKIYVQHKLLQHAADVFDWLENGAYVYICGAKEPMSYDVEKALLEIIAQQKNIDTSQAAAYLEQMKEDGKLLKDVY